MNLSGNWQKIVLASFILCVSVAHGQLLTQAHAHNDYLKKPPLFAALEHGITSIEVDVFDVKGEVRIAHIPLFLKNKPLLKDQYLAPLAQRISQNGGTVFKNDSTQLILMIELKRNHSDLLQLLKTELEPYHELIDIPRGNNKRWGPIKILLTGGVSTKLISSDELAIFTIDGGLSSLKNKIDPNLVPRISMNYTSHFKWKGRGKMPEAEKKWLIETINQANALGYEIRFWNMPNKEVIWEEFLRLGVHRINVDKYERFARFKSKMN
jgi:hypothetical protein